MHCSGNQSYPNDSPLGVKTKSQVCSHEIWSRIGVGLFKQVCVSSFASSLVTFLLFSLSYVCFESLTFQRLEFKFSLEYRWFVGNESLHEEEELLKV